MDQIAHFVFPKGQVFDLSLVSVFTKKCEHDDVNFIVRLTLLMLVHSPSCVLVEGVTAYT